MGTPEALQSISNFYQGFISSKPLFMQNFINLFIIVFVIVLYSFFVWKFYRFVAHKNIFSLNLKQYNNYSDPFLAKVLAIGLYLLEYILILPFIIFFWFAIFTFFLLLLAGEVMFASEILLLSATIVAAIRMASYIPSCGQKISEEIAKIFPYLILATTILNPKTLTTDFFPKFIERLMEIPFEISNILLYLGFILFLEIILRFFNLAFSLLKESEEETN